MTPLIIYMNHDFPPEQHTELERAAFDRRRLALLGPTTLYVSIGRGSTTDQNALADQLTAGKLGSVYLDAFTPAPPPATASGPRRACTSPPHSRRDVR